MNLKKKRWKQLLVTNLVATPVLATFLTLACSKSNDSTSNSSLTQADVDNEQTIINDLSPSSVNLTETLTETTDQPFTEAIATKFGFSEFKLKANFTYTYSHPAINEDGSLNFTIQVKTSRLIARNVLYHELTISGINSTYFAKANDAIRNITSSVIPETEFKNKTIGSRQLNANTIYELGIAIPTDLPQQVIVSFSKAFGSAKISYVLTYFSKNTSLEVTFTQFGTIDQNSVQNEQRRFSKTLSQTEPLSVQTTISPITSPQSFTQAVATSFKLTNFDSLTGYTYTYTHPGINKNGKLDLSIIVTRDGITSIDTTGFSVEVNGINAATVTVAENALKGVLSSTLSQLRFDQVLIPQFTTLSTDLKTSLGVAIPTTINSVIDIQVQKAAESSRIDYKLSIDGEENREFSVEVNSFGLPTQDDLSYEQQFVNNMMGGKRIDLDDDTLTIPAVTSRAAFTPAIANYFGFSSFRTKRGFTYEYTNPSISQDGILAVTIYVSTTSTSASNARANNIPVIGFSHDSIIRARNLIRKNYVFSSLSKEEILQLNDFSTTFNQSTLASKYKLENFGTLPQDVTITYTKAVDTNYLTFIITKDDFQHRTVELPIFDEYYKSSTGAAINQELSLLSTNTRVSTTGLSIPLKYFKTVSGSSKEAEINFLSKTSDGLTTNFVTDQVFKNWGFQNYVLKYGPTYRISFTLSDTNSFTNTVGDFSNTIVTFTVGLSGSSSKFTATTTLKVIAN